MRLQDPRHYPTAPEPGELGELAAEAATADTVRRPAALRRLRQALAEVLRAGDEIALAAALRGAPDAEHLRALEQALSLAIDVPEPQEALIARVFALPIVLIAAATQHCRIAGALPDIAALQALFVQQGVVGPMRNFGISNALVSLERLQALAPLAPLAVYRASRALAPQALHVALPPEAIEIEGRREQVHLRFLIGAGIVAADAPGFTETAANIGAWGRECARMIGTQLAMSGLQLLVLPRPPRDVLAAAHAGRSAQLEVAFDLYASNAMRRLRTAAGEPTAIVSTHDDADLRVTLTSVFAEDLVEGFRWPLAPDDDLAGIERHVAQLFEDARLTDVRYVPDVLPALRPNGALFYPRAGEWDETDSARLPQ